MPTLNWIGKDKVVNHHMDVSIYPHEFFLIIITNV